MRAQGLTRGRVGVCGYQHIISARSYAALTGSLPSVNSSTRIMWSIKFAR